MVYAACCSMFEASPWKSKTRGAGFDGSYFAGIDSRYSRSTPSTTRCLVVIPAVARRPQPLDFADEVAADHVVLQAGAGIVADSSPDKEYAEVEHKTRALRRALARLEN